MTDKNKSLNLLIEKERNETNEQLLIENKDLKQRISLLLAHISSLESKLNNLYHQEEKEVKSEVKTVQRKELTVKDLEKLKESVESITLRRNPQFPKFLETEIEEPKRTTLEALKIKLGSIPENFDIDKFKETLNSRPSELISWKDEQMSVLNYGSLYINTQLKNKNE